MISLIISMKSIIQNIDNNKKMLLEHQKQFFFVIKFHNITVLLDL